MYAHEPRVSHIQAAREHVVAIHQSLNTPHLAIPGKAPQSCQLYLVGTANTDGSFTVWVFLHLTETEEGVIFLSENRAFPRERYQAEWAEAQAFAESMGFMTDDLHFRERPPEDQEELIKTLPCFRKLTGVKKAAGPTKQESLARLLASF
ncbi:MAG: social motility and stimulation tgl protein [Deltaproteobacteria bacterium]|nr:social motility and stimulation tgl protein [Deltaproteobacteria bacterium]